MISTPEPAVAASAPTGARVWTGWSNENHPRKELRCRLQLPPGAVCGSSSLLWPGEKRPLVDLAWFRVFEQVCPLEILVQATAMTHEVALCDYYRNWARSAGEKELSLTLDNDDPDAPSQWVERVFPDGQTWIARRAGFKVWQGFHGWVVTVHVACPAARFADHAQLLESIASSLCPVETADYRLAEHLRLVTRGQPVDFASYLPISWRELPHRHDLPGPFRLAFRKSLRNRTCGFFNLVVGDKQQFPGSGVFLREALSGWTAIGLDPASIPFQPTGNWGAWQAVRGSVEFESLERAVPDGTAPGGSKRYALQLGLADAGSHWFHAETIGPTAEDDPEAWAINRRALELFARNFRTG